MARNLQTHPMSLITLWFVPWERRTPVRHIFHQQGFLSSGVSLSLAVFRENLKAKMRNEPSKQVWKDSR
jgi:hypothetical protein